MPFIAKISRQLNVAVRDFAHNLNGTLKLPSDDVNMNKNAKKFSW